MFIDNSAKHNGVYLTCVNHDQIFANLSFKPVIANDLDIITLEGKDQLNKMMYNTYEGDSLNVLPTCDCGSLVGARYLTTVCSNCNTECVYMTEKSLESLLWIRKPKGIDKLISPVAWIIISEAFTSTGFNLLLWLTDPAYESTSKSVIKLQNKLQKYLDFGIPRGLNSFYRNFDAIIDLVYKLKLIKDFGPDKDDLQQWIKKFRNDIFADHLPIPSKVGFVVENSGASTYIDETITLAFDAIRAVIAIDSSSVVLSDRRTQSKTVFAIKTLASYYKAFASDTLGGKPGIFRKHVFGGSLMFTARAVISSLTENHSYDEIHLPWSLSLQLLKLHIAAKLNKAPYNYSPNRINKMLRDYALTYHPVLDTVMQQLIDEAPLGKLPCVFQRNPSLNRGSAQLLFITKIKKDPAITTISFSVLALRACNADFDGDEMNLLLVLDYYTYTRLSRLEPHLYALDLNAPRRVSSYLALPGPVISTIAEWLYNGE